VSASRGSGRGLVRTRGRWPRTRTRADRRAWQRWPVELTCSRNESRFREGDMLLLNRGDPFADPRILVALEADDDACLLISSDDPALAWGAFAD
jgi:hypothetical protein